MKKTAAELRECGLHVTVESVDLITGRHIDGLRRFVLRRWEDGRWCATLIGMGEQNVGPGDLDKVVAVMKTWYGGCKSRWR